MYKKNEKIHSEDADAASAKQEDGRTVDWSSPAGWILRPAASSHPRAVGAGGSLAAVLNNRSRLAEGRSNPAKV
jgi:hypothetical protein